MVWANKRTCGTGCGRVARRRRQATLARRGASGWENREQDHGRNGVGLAAEMGVTASGVNVRLVFSGAGPDGRGLDGEGAYQDQIAPLISKLGRMPLAAHGRNLKPFIMADRRSTRPRACVCTVPRDPGLLALLHLA